MQANYPVAIDWIHFPLHPDTPEAGLELADLFRGRDIQPMQRAMAERMRDAGLAYGDRSRTYNSRLAQELAKWAVTQAGGSAIHDALFRTYFVDGNNLASIGVLVDVAAGIGLDAAAARQVLEQRSFSPQVERDWQTSRELGITGVPAFLADNQLLVGCQPYAVLEKYIQYVQKLNSRS